MHSGQSDGLLQLCLASPALATQAASILGLYRTNTLPYKPPVRALEAMSGHGADHIQKQQKLQWLHATRNTNFTKQFGKITRHLQPLTHNKRSPLEEEESHFKRKVTTLEYSKCSNFQSTSTQRKRKMWHISRKRRIRQTLSGESQTLGWLVKDANSTSCMCSNCSRKLWTKN